MMKKWNEFILYYLNVTMNEWIEEFGEINRKKNNRYCFRIKSK